MSMIVKELIEVNVDLYTKSEVLKYLANSVVKAGYSTDQEAVLTALSRREEESTTGMMDGYAIPHAQDEAIIEPIISVLKFNQGVDWDSLDGKPVTKVVALFIPKSEVGQVHLKLLSTIARLLMKKEFKELFEQANTSEELYSLLVNSLELE